MSVELQEQRVRYVGNGTARTFPFPFTVEDAEQVQVVLAQDGGDDVTLDLNSHYSVALNDDGTGSVTLAQTLPTGYVLALVSNIEISQERAFYNNTPYYQEQIEGGLDKLTRICQQLKELADRHLTVPATSSKNPQQVMTEIFGTVSRANEYAQMATDAYQASVELKETVEQQVAQVGDEQVERIEDVGKAEVQDVQAEGQVQLDRLAGYADVGALAEGLAAACQVWKLAEDVPAGSTVTLPNELKYIPGHHHLWLSYGGMVISPTFFEEVGDGAATSSSFVTKIPFRAGQELMAWVIPLGRVYEVELTDRVNALEEAFAELSRRVVYAEEPTNATEATA